MDVALVLAVSTVLTRAILATVSPQLAKTVKSGLVSLLVALFFAASAIVIGYVLYIVVMKYAAMGTGGSVGQYVRIGIWLLRFLGGLMLFFLR
jgi:hypothetical protein